MSRHQKAERLPDHTARTKSWDNDFNKLVGEKNDMSPAEKETLRSSLGPVPANVMKFIGNNGVSLHVVRPGESLIDKGFVKDQGMENFGKVTRKTQKQQMIRSANGKQRKRKSIRKV